MLSRSLPFWTPQQHQTSKNYFNLQLLTDLILIKTCEKLKAICLKITVGLLVVVLTVTLEGKKDLKTLLESYPNCMVSLKAFCDISQGSAATTVKWYLGHDLTKPFYRLYCRRASNKCFTDILAAVCRCSNFLPVLSKSYKSWIST